MNNGYIVISILLLLFLSMYGFGYLSVVFENIKAKTSKKKLVKLREQRNLIKLNNQTKRDEKLVELLKRSEHIRQQLRALQLKKEMRMQMQKNKMKIEHIKMRTNERQVG